MLVESFIKYIRYELNYSACTVLSYNNDLKQFKEFLTGGASEFNAQSGTTNDVRAWLANVASSGCSMRRKVDNCFVFTIVNTSESSKV